jgi:hypothetical protein
VWFVEPPLLSRDFYLLGFCMSEELAGTSLAISHDGSLKAKPHQALGTTDEDGIREFFGFKRRHALIKEPLSYEENKRSITIGLSVFSMN